MAKQSGLHQIRGKVGEHSYYRQSGITSGLIRSINQSLSGRVKTGDEYANTRLNNAEFRNAAELASAMGGIIHPKFRPMILPFSQSKLTSAYLELIKETVGQWGQRNAVLTQAQQIADALNAIAKKRYADMFTDIDPLVVAAGTNTAIATVGWSADQANNLASLGISGVKFKATGVRLAIGEYDSSIGKNRKTGVTMLEPASASIAVNLGESDDVDLEVPVAPLNLPGYVGIGYVIVIAMPYRTIGGVDHTLQEYCTFKCVPFTFAA